MGIITVSREYGSDGRTVGLKVAECLGYHYVDKELIVRVSLEANVPVSEVENLDERPEPSIMRGLRKFLAPTYPGIPPGLGMEEWGSGMGFPVLTKQEIEGLSVMDEDAYVQLTRKVMERIRTSTAWC